MSQSRAIRRTTCLLGLLSLLVALEPASSWAASPEGWSLFSALWPFRGEPADASAVRPFPVFVSFEAPRTFGFMIGDLVPVDLIIRVSGGAAVDLVTLPAVQDRVGPFEVRSRSITIGRDPEGTRVYRVSYLLQSFFPGFVSSQVSLPPLAVRFVTEEDLKENEEAPPFRTLYTPPFTLQVSSIAADPRVMQPIRGALEPGRELLTWATLLGGLLLLSVAAASFLIQLRARVRRALPPEEWAQRAVAGALAQYEQDGDAVSFFARVSHALRHLLQARCGFHATSQTPAQIERQLPAGPWREAMIGLLQACHRGVHTGLRYPRFDSAAFSRQALAAIAQMSASDPVRGAKYDAQGAEYEVRSKMGQRSRAMHSEPRAHGSWTQDSGPKTQDSGPRTQDSGPRTQDPGHRTQDPAPRTSPSSRLIPVESDLARLSEGVQP